MINNAPSPPLLKLLKEYGPKLVKQRGIRTSTVMTPESIKEVLKKAVSARNKVAHGRDHQVHPDFLERTLLAVQDTLWMLDVFQGHEWARDNVRLHVLEKWDPHG